MTNKHEHKECEHEVKYCKICDVCYCEKCGKEWKKYYTYQHYYTPNIYTYKDDETINVSFEDHTHEY